MVGLGDEWHEWHEWHECMMGVGNRMIRHGAAIISLSDGF